MGQTIDLNRRIAEHLYESSRNNDFKIYQALRKYGFDNFEVVVLEEVSGDSESVLTFLNIKEIEYVEQFNSFIDGYNMTKGSRGSLGLQHSDETRLKISKKTKGRKLSERHKQRIVESNSSRIVTEQTKNKMSENNAMKSKDNRKKISEKYKEQSPEQIQERCKKSWDTRRKNGDVSEQQRQAAYKGHETRKRNKLAP